MLQIKNTLGGGKPEGLYVWKKYEVIPPTIVTDPSFKHYGDSSYARIYIISPNFDVNAIDDWVSFFDGFSVNGEGNSYIFSKSGNTLRVKPSSTTSYVSVTDFVISSGSSDYGDYVAYFTLASALSYSVKTNKYIGDKEITQLKTGTFLDYIVSDKETAYPNGGEQGGYWYEKVGDLANAFGYTKMAIDYYVATENSKSIKFPHSLGEEPKLAIVLLDYTKGKDITFDSYNRMAMKVVGGGARTNWIKHMIAEFSATNSTSSIYAVSSTSFTPPSSGLTNTYVSSGGYYLYVGIPYTIVTFA